MRILFCTWAWPSHLYPMVPLAWACRAAGHDVRVASQPGLLPAINQTGLPAVPIGRDTDAASMVRRYVIDPGAARPSADARPRALDMLIELARSMTGELVDHARFWQPDLIVYELTSWAGPLTAAALGVPAVRMLYGLDMLERAGEHLPDAVRTLTEEFGLPETDVRGDLTIDACPPRLQLPTRYTPQQIRYMPYNGPATVPNWLAPSGDRPRVCVTWGTTMAKLGPERVLAGTAADALSSMDADVLVAVPDAQRELLGPLPRHVRVVGPVALHLLLPHCDLVVHHGGAGTLLTALVNGVPQLMVPQLPDHALHARQLANAGAGMALSRQDCTPRRLWAAANELIDSAPHRTAARELAADAWQRPTPAEVVPVLEKLAGAELA